ncbi:MAG TPA: hypothetical protein VGT60_10820 [Candidatus Limnocylindria bacterium]|nr:hypothetical protein [Candidatus Limnocylindria bacterium]
MAVQGNTTKPPRSNQLIGLAIEVLRERLPPGWKIDFGLDRPPTRERPDAVVRVQSPDGRVATFVVEAKTGSAPIRARLNAGPPSTRENTQVPLVVAPFISADLRDELRRHGIAYVDATGNADVRVGRPGLFITSTGADRNPWPTDRPARSLRAPKAARVVRALTDFAEPLGVRRVAALANVDAGYASRVMRMLREEGLLIAAPRGAVTRVDRAALVRRWATDYDIAMSNRLLPAFEPRDLSLLVVRVRDLSRKSAFKYAFTGSWAANHSASVAATRLLTCFVERPESLAESLDLRTGETLSNVWLVEPYDPIAFDRGGREQGVNLAAPAQVLVDLMTSPGRAPAEADAYLSWLKGNDPLWHD